MISGTYHSVIPSMDHSMVIYSRPSFDFPELNAPLDVVIAECEAREAHEDERGSKVCVMNTHIGSDLNVCTILGDVLFDFTMVENKKTVSDDNADNVAMITIGIVLVGQAGECTTYICSKDK